MPDLIKRFSNAKRIARAVSRATDAVVPPALGDALADDQLAISDRFEERARQHAVLPSGDAYITTEEARARLHGTARKVERALDANGNHGLDRDDLAMRLDRGLMILNEARHEGDHPTLAYGVEYLQKKREKIASLPNGPLRVDVTGMVAAMDRDSNQCIDQSEYPQGAALLDRALGALKPPRPKGGHHH